MFSFKEILNEQMIKKNKIWYHGSRNENKIELIKGADIFLTSVYDYALGFATNYIYTFISKRPLNIFNPSSIKDLKLLIKILNNNPKYWESINSWNYKDRDYLGYVRDCIRRHDSEDLEYAGVGVDFKDYGYTGYRYDGYVCTEKSDNIHLFDQSLLKIINIEKIDDSYIRKEKISRKDYVAKDNKEYPSYFDIKPQHEKELLNLKNIPLTSVNHFKGPNQRKECDLRIKQDFSDFF
jgi:hypothetical protein